MTDWGVHLIDPLHQCLGEPMPVAVSALGSKFYVEDNEGVQWLVKVGEEAQPEIAATRFVWAMGYFTDEDYYLPAIRVSGIPHLHRGNNSIAPGGRGDVVVSGLPTTGVHTAHPFVIDPRGNLFLTSGSATNVCEVTNRSPASPGNNSCTELETRAGIWRFDANMLPTHLVYAEHPAHNHMTNIAFGGPDYKTIYITEAMSGDVLCAHVPSRRQKDFRPGVSV